MRITLITAGIISALTFSGCSCAKAVSLKTDDTLNLDTPFYYPANRKTYKNMDKIFNGEIIKKSSQPYFFRTEKSNLGKLSVTHGYDEFYLDDIGKFTYVDSIVVVKDGLIRYEKYFGGQTEFTKHQLNSISKSITWAAVQPLIDSGKLSYSRTVGYYIPDFKGSAWEDVTIAQVIGMTSSLKFNEDYSDAASGFNNYLRAGGFFPEIKPAPGLFSFLKMVKKGPYPHGSRFSYATPNTDVLCIVSERVTGEPAWKLIEDNVWDPMGAVNNAFIISDSTGQSFCGAGISATTRDLALFGMNVMGAISGSEPKFNNGLSALLKDKGDIKSWNAGVYGDGSHIHTQGYNKFWWFSRNNDDVFYAEGINGQLLYINIKANIVISINSSFRKSDSHDDWEYLFNLADEIAKNLKQYDK